MRTTFIMSVIGVIFLSAIVAAQTFRVTGTATHTGDRLDLVLTLTPDSEPPPQPSLLSQAMGKWTPNLRFDTCTTAEHDAIYVVGPDGKLYPTWHEPKFTRADGSVCTFGHEHGRNPRESLIWAQAQQYFYFDQNKNGLMDPPEQAAAGFPFGYVNEQLDAAGLGIHRHEDHVGHKVEWANGEPDLATHNMSTDPIGGVWVGQHGNGIVQHDTGVRCFYLAKAHQGTSTADAFTNNVHEVFYFASCQRPDGSQAQKISTAQLVSFGRVGGFTSFMPLCRIERRNDPQDRVELGTDAINKGYPSGPGDREIPTRQCAEIGFLVLDGEFSGNLYEAWPAPLSLVRQDTSIVFDGVNVLFDVNDAARYYYPDDLKAQRGYNNPAAGPRRGFAMDLCYDTSLPGRRYRGGPCDTATKYGTILDITWDDPRSGFRGLNRGMYFMPARVQNAGGPEVWYADPFGRQARTMPFPGSIRHVVSAVSVHYSDLIGGRPLDPRVAMRVHTDGGDTVHAPN